jgi:hypothetical protein
MDTILDFSAGFLLASHHEWDARRWSNREVRRLAPLFQGRVINVSAGQDKDKEKGCYRDYFTGATEYRVSNYVAAGLTPEYGEELILDLSRPIPAGFPQFDLVFNHTVIEHIFEVETVIDNLCKLSGESVMTIAPFMQPLHGLEGVFSDYWRFSPFALVRAFEKHGFTTVYLNWNRHHALSNVYVMHIATRQPQKYNQLLPPLTLPIFGSGTEPGNEFNRLIYPVPREQTIARRLGQSLGRHLRTPSP